MEQVLQETQRYEFSTAERKYFRSGPSFIKRSLRPHEYQKIPSGIYVPPLSAQRLQNEAACLRFIRRQTDIPVPNVYAEFEDDGAYYLVTEYIDGISMSKVSEDKKPLILEELDQYLFILRNIKSKKLGGPLGLLVIPIRVTEVTGQDIWKLQSVENEEYQFCHNDLSEYNVIVDPQTFRIKAIIDWEYSGFFPAFFEAPVYTRKGARALETDDSENVRQMIDFLRSRELPTEEKANS